MAGTYAPRRKPIVVDYAKMREEADAARREQAAIEEAARDARSQFDLDNNPTQQLINRHVAAEQRLDGLEQRLARLEEQLHTIGELVRELHSGTPAQDRPRWASFRRA